MSAVENKQNAVFLELGQEKRGAFETVAHNLLLLKPLKYVIKGVFWISTHSNNREWYVKTNHN